MNACRDECRACLDLSIVFRNQYQRAVLSLISSFHLDYTLSDHFETAQLSFETNAKSETPAPLPLALVSFVWTLTTGLQVMKLVQRSPQRKEAQERVMGVRHCYPLFSTSAKIIGLDAFLRSDGRQPSRGTVWKLSRSHVPQQRRPRHYIRSPIEPHETAYCAPKRAKT